MHQPVPKQAVAVAHEHAPGDGQVAVEPGVPQAAAVGLRFPLYWLLGFLASGTSRKAKMQAAHQPVPEQAVAVAHEHAPGDGQVAVEPDVPQAAAVGLRFPLYCFSGVLGSGTSRKAKMQAAHQPVPEQAVAVAHEHAPGDGQVAVEPGVPQAAAVGLHVDHEEPRLDALGARLQLQAGAAAAAHPSATQRGARIQGHGRQLAQLETNTWGTADSPKMLFCSWQCRGRLHNMLCCHCEMALLRMRLCCTVVHPSSMLYHWAPRQLYLYQRGPAEQRHGHHRSEGHLSVCAPTMWKPLPAS